MRARSRLLICALAVSGTGGAVLALSAGDGDVSAAGPPRSAPALGCAERISGAVIRRDGRTVRDPLTVRRARDTVIGPVAFSGLRSYTRMSWDRMVLERQWLKSVALVESGARVTLEVPREQRTWMRLDYRHGGSGSAAVTLEGCRVSRTQQAQERECQIEPYDACRRGPTAFSGGFLIEYARAPKQGRCAEIIVWVDGVREPLRERLVSARAGRCG